MALSVARKQGFFEATKWRLSNVPGGLELRRHASIVDVLLRGTGGAGGRDLEIENNIDAASKFGFFGFPFFSNRIRRLLKLQNGP